MYKYYILSMCKKCRLYNLWICLVAEHFVNRCLREWVNNLIFWKYEPTCDIFMTVRHPIMSVLYASG
ncbi:hypothetical protein BDFB_009576 [Asbolus verrucosus]|uniref:Uncharacterized protein n=1 Tax=Asbolus verrucosus TaxID=1661398 RepID=A0A482WCF8_ASBVE|nr:hypothetical protein BDFB_009576 [Asbolus verrucosus]